MIPTKKLGNCRCLCQACGSYFNSTFAFDKHRVGDYKNEAKNRRCLTEKEMRDRAMGVNHDGYWVSEFRLPDSD